MSAWSAPVGDVGAGHLRDLIASGAPALDLARAFEAYDAAVRREIDALRDRALVQEREAEGLRRMALTDPLTGIWNRAGLDVRAAEEFSRCAREERRVAVIMVDVDRFKAYNDRNGHQAGDEALRRVAEALRASFRRGGDVVARYGGEEFAVVLPGAGLAEGLAAAEKARRAVRTLAIPHADSERGRVTASFGVAAADMARERPGLSELIAAADGALYRAKDEGRDLVVGAEDDRSLELRLERERRTDARALERDLGY